MQELTQTLRTLIPTSVTSNTSTLPWIQVARDAPYFTSEDGTPWFPIGQNDSITWPQMTGVYARRDMEEAERYFGYLANHGVTCLRMMLEYSEGNNRYFEDPASHYDPRMIQAWDDIFALCDKYELRMLLTPFDTFWMRIRWWYHPYNAANGGHVRTARGS